MKVLIIEDDQTLASNLEQLLSNDAFAVDTAHSKESGLGALEVNEYDCIILDLGLPDGNGFELLKQLRQTGNTTPTIIVTARGETSDKIKGLDLGADDYVAKPFNTNELIARIRSVIRRNSNHALPVITVGKLAIKPAEHLATVGSSIIDLTAKEFAILEYLAQHSGQVITRTMLMEHVWGSDFETFSNVIDVYIRTLRRKLEPYAASKLIRTIRGKGYILGKRSE